MNVKANMLLSQLDGLDHLFIPLSPADESNVFGAAYWITEKHLIENQVDPETIPPLKSPYLGRQFSRPEVLTAVDSFKSRNPCHVFENVDRKKIAELLSQGWTVATCRGRSEFGQRALGNRSILADPSKPGIVEKINRQIKYRDFWMPFCPTILWENQHEYLQNEKQIEVKYMTMALPVKSGMKEPLRGVIHPGDNSARPQLLKEEDNPDYYELIRDFRNISGLGVLLNTSFNMHGEPIVDRPEEALRTFEKSELDAVWLEDVLVTRCPPPDIME